VCGISGAFSTDGERPILADGLERIAHALAHRGPDGGGRHLAGPVGMSMRRLSTTHLTSSDPAMCNEDGALRVVFNGEIYNYRELTADRIAHHRFVTSSDTEVPVRLHEEHGERCVEPLRGMFAAQVRAEFGMDRMHERIGSCFYCLALGTVHGALAPREAIKRA
jgi:asparagine synthase (glutamine-hydrolysing)